MVWFTKDQRAWFNLLSNTNDNRRRRVAEETKGKGAISVLPVMFTGKAPEKRRTLGANT
jgi:hypothetical protein